MDLSTTAAVVDRYAALASPEEEVEEGCPCPCRASSWGPQNCPPRQVTNAFCVGGSRTLGATSEA